MSEFDSFLVDGGGDAELASLFSEAEAIVASYDAKLEALEQLGEVVPTLAETLAEYDRLVANRPYLSE